MGISDTFNSDKNKLELGCGQNPTDGYLTVDYDVSTDADFVGDIRAIFSPDYDLKDYPQIEKLSYMLEQFSEVRAQHFVEHVQWLYQRPMFEWVWRALAPGGEFVVETPDLEWIAKSYLKNRRKHRFPRGDHPDLSEDEHFGWWVNFKVFSGCSFGDYHHCLYDAELLKQTYKHCGFVNIRVRRRGGTLYGFAIKPIDKTETEGDDYYKA